MTSSDLDRVIRACQAVTTLTSLQLDCCDIDPNGGLLLALLVRHHPSLQVLSASGDPYKRPFTYTGCVAAVSIARALENPASKLHTLRFVLTLVSLEFPTLTYSLPPPHFASCSPPHRSSFWSGDLSHFAQCSESLIMLVGCNSGMSPFLVV